MTFYPFCFRTSSALFLCGTLGLASAIGGGTVTSCTQSDLEAALAGGGTVLFSCSGTIPLTNTIVIAQNTSLDANGNAVTISGGNAVRFFQVASNVEFRVKALTLADGWVLGPNGPNGDPALPGQDGFGAGILNQGGTVALTDCVLTNHHVQGGNAGQDVVNASGNTANGGNAKGAAIYNAGGTVNLTNCQVSGNSATGGFGSPGGGLSFFGTGDCGHAFGGAIYSAAGTVTLEGLALTTNSAQGGTPQSDGVEVGRGGDGVGGAIYATNSTVYLADSVLVNNTALGGGVNAGRGFGPGSGAGMGGALFLSQDSSGDVEASVISTNSAIGLDTSPNVSPGGAGMGGALFTGGNLRILNTTFSGNLCRGASYSSTAGPGLGGAVYSSNILVIVDSTFESNLALGGNQPGFSDGGPGGRGEGGAVWSSGSLNATNSTWTANRAAAGTPFQSIPQGGPASGGAVCITAGAAMLVNVTLAANRADGAIVPDPRSTNGPSQGGGLSNTNGTITIRNSIVANSPNGGDTWGIISDGGYNICSDGTANFSAIGSLNRVDPMLSALSSNGGLTPTMALLIGSPARDAIPSGFPPTDQRGVSRPQGPAADIGAFEADFISASPIILAQPTGMTVRAGANVTLSVLVSGSQPFSYQWSKNGNPLAGATASFLSLSNVQATAAGTYLVIVTNAFGSATSQGAGLVVDSTPLILAQPASVVVSPGASTNFSVLADGPTLTYQWWHDNSIVPGANASILAFTNAMAGAQGNYFVVVSNFAGTATSAVATLSFDASVLSILVPPKDVTVEAGYPASFSVLASGVPPFAYQWQHGGVVIAGATNRSLTLPAVGTNDAGSYNVVVANGYRIVTSASANLTITPGAVPPQLFLGRFLNNVTITFDAQGGRTYRLLSSSNLTAWLPVATNSAVLAGPLQFVQPITAAPKVFYRMVTP